MTLDDLRHFCEENSDLDGRLEVNVVLPGQWPWVQPNATVDPADSYSHTHEIMHSPSTSISNEEIMIICGSTYDY